MKLNKTTINALARLTTEEEPQTQSMLDSALAMARLGFGVFPLAPGRKGPLIGKAQGGKGALDGTTDEDQIRRWWQAEPRAGVGLSMGEDLIGIDLDFDHGCPEEVLDLWPETRTHYSGRRNGNRHLIYRVKPGSVAQRNGWVEGIDLKAGAGGYLVGPPSLHEETGHPYTIGDENGGEIAPIDEATLLSIADSLGVDLPLPKGAPKLRVVNGKKASDDSDRKTLIYLLDHPGEGGRNNWLTRVAGHYARDYHGKKDLYDHHCRAAYDMVAADDFDWAEASKTIESIWSTEESGHPEREAGVVAGGWLTEKNGRLVCPAKFGDDIAMVEYAPWAIDASGVAIDKDHKRVYWVTLRIDGQRIEMTIPGETMGDVKKLTTMLASFGADYLEPPSAYPHAPIGVRLQRYLKSQSPPQIQITERLGLQKTALGQVFVTLDGVITAEVVHTKEEVGVVADPALVKNELAPYHYGFSESRERAVAILRQVLGFQDAEVASVFGAWWAACWLKPAIVATAGLFPFMGIEATSGSGKTTGFFSFMVQLNGNTHGQTLSTRASFRDSTGANHNGIVWVDDADKIEELGEILRASSNEGEMVKKAENNTSQVKTKIVAPILVSGEALDIDDQKALVDRSILLTPPPVRNRVNAEGKPQLVDINKLKGKYPLDELGLSVMSGWYVQAALRHQDAALAVINEYPKNDRLSTKYAILVAGAMLLDTILAGGDEWVTDGDNVGRVRAWIARDETGRLEHDNTLTQKLIPEALELCGYPTSPYADIPKGLPGQDGEVPVWMTPAEPGTLDRPRIFFRATQLALFNQRVHGRSVDRTETKQQIVRQAQAMGLKAAQRRVPGDRNAAKPTAYELPTEYVDLVLTRANYTQH